MKFDYPQTHQIPQLRQLWKDAFGDPDEFLDGFFATGYDSRRCRCALAEGRVAAALYWFDISWDNLKCAYLYAVATDPGFRGRGLCRQLMADTAALLKEAGYDGLLLVPQEEGLFAMYRKMGYLPATNIAEFHCAGADAAASIREISAAEYASRRASLLPPGAVIQEGNNLPFLEWLARFYVCDDSLAAVSRAPNHLRVLEYLGDLTQAGELVAALGQREATIRTPGTDRPYSMYLPLTSRCNRPGYFAFCFD